MSIPGQFHIEEVVLGSSHPNWSYWNLLRETFQEVDHAEGYYSLQSENGVVIGKPINSDPWIMTPDQVIVFRVTPENSGSGQVMARITAQLRFQGLVESLSSNQESEVDHGINE